MEPSLFTKIIDQLPNATVVVPFFRGESLIHPYFPEFMRQLSAFKKVQLASNGDYLTLENQTAILTACTFFSLSLHSFIMPWHFKHANFLKIARKSGLETQVSILEGHVPERHKKRFIREWMKNASRVRIYKEHSASGFGDMAGEQKPSSACMKTQTDVVVYWDGKVGLCNHDWNNRTPLGDLNTESLEQVWNGEPYQEVRALHKSGNRSKVPSCMECCFSNKVYGELYSADSQQQTA